MLNPVDLGLTMFAAVTVIALLAGGFSGAWRIAWRLFLLGLAIAAVELAVITLLPALGTWITERRSR